MPWREIVPAYDSLLLQSPYDMPRNICEDVINAKLGGFKPQADIDPPQHVIDIPVIYGGSDGPDLEHVSKTAGLSIEEIIYRHSQSPYLVCLMGFIPGFAFMSETDPVLHMPRRAAPRASIPAGSIGLAGWQTGIYGLTSPGGWQIIGRTPLVMFDPQRDPAFLLKAGDWVRFIPQRAGTC